MADLRANMRQDETNHCSELMWAYYDRANRPYRFHVVGLCRRMFELAEADLVRAQDRQTSLP